MHMRISKLKLLILMAMSVVGLWASSMVVVIFYALKGQLPLCPTGSFEIWPGGPHIYLDCGAVLGSKYSVVYGVPLEFLALAYFIINLILVYLIAFGSDSVFKRSMRILFGWRFLGLLLVPYLLFIEVVLIRAICVYCTIMHVAIVVDFIVISYLLFYKRDSLQGPPPVPAPTVA